MGKSIKLFFVSVFSILIVLFFFACMADIKIESNRINVGNSTEITVNTILPVFPVINNTDLVSLEKTGDTYTLTGKRMGDTTICFFVGFLPFSYEISIDDPSLQVYYKDGTCLEIVSGISPTSEIVWQDPNVGKQSLYSGDHPIPVKVNGQTFVNDSILHFHRAGTWKETTAPTCTRSGSETLYCLSCNLPILFKQLPEPGHNYQDSVCTRCWDTEYQDEDDQTVILSEMLCQKIGLSLSGDVIIPSSISLNGRNYRVVGIGYAMFFENASITSITLPDTITYIGDMAFSDCTKLRSIQMQEGVKYIGKAAFQLCSSLEQVSLPESVQFIGDFAYNHCTRIENDTIVLPSALESLGKYTQYPAHMFYDCGTNTFTQFQIAETNEFYKVEDGILYSKDGTTLVSIPRGKIFEDHTYVMPNTITHLGELTFSRNPSIETVVISDQLTIDPEPTTEERVSYENFGNDLAIACYGYTPVKAYETRETNPNYLSIDGVLYTKDQKEIVAIPNHYTGDLVIPEGVEIWNEDTLWTEVEYFKDIAFHQIESISIPASMIQIDEDQIKELNLLVDYYGTTFRVSEENPIYTVDSLGYLKKK